MQEPIKQTLEETINHPQWNFLKKIIFRFVFIYLLLSNLPFPAEYIPILGNKFSDLYTDLWNSIVSWVGKKFFHIANLHFQFTGSGDTTFNYVQLLSIFVIAFIVCLIWSLLDRKRTNYQKLHRWLRVYIRFSLATTMIAYGAVKVIKSQFPDPSLWRLLQPYGESSPMGILWTFMGSSQGYNTFTGSAEMLGGILLALPQTTMLGSLVCIGVLSNVVMLNLCYDVPVKLLSSQLLFMAIFLAAPDLKRLANIFILNRSVEAVAIEPLFKYKWFNIAARVFGVIFIVYLSITGLSEAQISRKTYGDFVAKSPFYGIWNVEEFEIDGESRPPLLTDAKRWRRLIFDRMDRNSIQFMDDSRYRFFLSADLEKNTMFFGKIEDSKSRGNFSFQKLDAETMILEGTFEEHKIRAKLHQLDKSKLLLVNRGFHWINETPFNR